MFDYPKARPYLVLMPERALGRSASGVAFSLLYAVAVAGCGRPDKGQTTSEGRALAAIAFVQMDYATPQTPVSTVTVPFTGAPAEGNLNIVGVGWNNTPARVLRASDARGKVNQLRAGPPALTNTL